MNFQTKTIPTFIKDKKILSFYFLVPFIVFLFFSFLIKPVVVYSVVPSSIIYGPTQNNTTTEIMSREDQVGLLQDIGIDTQLTQDLHPGRIALLEQISNEITRSNERIEEATNTLNNPNRTMRQETRAADTLVEEMQNIINNRLYAQQIVADNENGIPFSWRATRRAERQRQREAEPVHVSCRTFDLTCHIANLAFHAFLIPAASILDLSGMFFDYIIENTIIKMNEFLFATDTSAVNTGWIIIRDITNIIFIFLILFVAIKTIIFGTGSTGKEIAMIIAIALLINFSLLFTKFVVDVGNNLTLSLYDSIAGMSASSAVPDSRQLDGTLSGAFIQRTGAVSVFGRGGRSSGWGEIVVRNSHDFVSVIKQSLTGAVILIIVAFVLFMASFLFLTRFVVLTFVFLSSSIALAGFLVPALKNHITNKWLKSLWGQTFFPAIFFILLLISLNIYDGVVNSLDVGSPSFASAGDLIDPSSFFSYVLIIIMTIASLIVAKSISNSSANGVNRALSKGSSWALNRASGATAFVARRSVGRIARYGAKSIKGENKYSKLLQSNLDRVGKSSLDFRNLKPVAGAAKAGGLDIKSGSGKGGYNQIVANKKTKTEKASERVGQLTIGEEKQMVKKTDRVNKKTSELEEVKEKVDKKQKSVTEVDREISKSNANIKAIENDAAVKTNMNLMTPVQQEEINKKIQAEKLNIQTLTETKKNLEQELSTHGSTIDEVGKEIEGLNKELEDLNKAGKTRQTNFYQKMKPHTVASKEFVREQKVKAIKKTSQKESEKILEELSKIMKERDKETAEGGKQKDTGGGEQKDTSGEDSKK